MEQSVYAQVVKLWRKDLQFFASEKNKSEAKFKFQVKYARSQLCFDLDLYLIDIHFSTREPDFYKNYFKFMTISKTILRSKHFKFQLEMQNL